MADRDIVFELRNNRVLHIASSVINYLADHRQLDSEKSEGGGQVFAKIDGECISVRKVSGPYPMDRRARFSFEPDKEIQAKDIRSFFRKGLHYVGDWHTHPERIPKPSSTDINSMQDSFRRSKHNLDSFILMIVGTDEIYLGLYNDREWVKLEPAKGSLKLLRPKKKLS